MRSNDLSVKAMNISWQYVRYLPNCRISIFHYKVILKRIGVCVAESLSDIAH
jgi:hypothetical protein